MDSNKQSQSETIHSARTETTSQSASVLDQFPVGYFFVSADGIIKYVNPLAAKMVGLDRDQLIGQCFESLVAATDRVAAKEFLVRVFAADSPQTSDFAMETSGRTSLQVRFDAACSVDGTDCHVTMIDITENKRAEAERDRFLTLSLDLMCVASTDGYFRKINPAFERILGFSREELFARPFLEFIHPDDRAATVAVVQTLSKGEKLEDFENRYVCKNGAVRWFLWTCVPFLTEGLLYAAASDITDRKQGEANRAHLAAIVESAEDAILSTDFNGKIQSWNPGAERLFGYSESQILGNSVTCLIPPDRIEEEAKILERIRGGSRVDRIETVRNKKDGTTVPISLTVSPMLNSAGQIIGVSKILRDITAQKAAQAEIQSLHVELEQRVRDRTAQLEAANKELEAFSYSVSHDLRAPLRSIDSFSRIILEDYGPKLDDEGIRLLNIVAGEAQRMGNLIDDLLNFSRLGRQELKASEFDMTDLAATVICEVPAFSEAATPQFDVKPLPSAFGDRSMIRQVLFNLISNAVKFSSRNPAPKIEIGAVTDDRLNTYYIKDNGVGFDPAYAHKLFGVFQRLHAEDEFEGTGVGLALVQRIVHRHGGKIWAEGKLDHGATFYFSLPFMKGPGYDHTTLEHGR